MPRSLRVLLEPEPRPSPGAGIASIDGCVVRLSGFGGATSKAQVDVEVAATLRFVGEFLERARPPAASELRELGKVSGRLSLQDRQPLFTVSSGPVASEPVLQPTQSLLALPRLLTLRFDGAQFRLEVPDDLVLELPDDFASPPRLLRLAVELTLDGGEEAAAEVNDVLDVPLRPRFVRVRLVDELGEPISDHQLEFSFGGKAATLTTDERGSARVDNPLPPSTRVRIVDADGLRKTLKARWDEPRPGARLRQGPGVEVVSFKSALDAITVGSGTTLVSVQPRVIKARVVGLFFETSKAFLLPSALTALRGMKRLYDANPGSQLLLVGHADRAGSVSYNDTLSLERADAMAAFLRDETAPWEKFYQASVAKEKRWGPREDRFMFAQLVDSTIVLGAPDPLAKYRELRGIGETGPIGPETRRRLIADYMGADETTLPTDVQLTTHGAGEHFPDVATPDGAESAENRRVEMFFFDGELGIQPAPPGKNSKAGSAEYPEWRQRADETHDFDLEAGEQRSVVIRLLDVDGRPLPGVTWTIDHPFGQETDITGDDGLVVAKIPSAVRTAILTHDNDSVQLEFESLPPAGDVAGAQHRLSNLGYDCGFPLSGQLDEQTVQALRRFQSDEELDPSGELDQKTSERLREAYGQ